MEASPKFPYPTMTKTVFFVDDEPVVRTAVEQTLTEFSCDVRCFPSGKSCLQALEAGVPCDLLITDINMPEMNGVELIREVRKLAPVMPVIAITGYGDIPMAVSAIKAGALEFIEKPLDENTFLPAVSKALNLRGEPQDQNDPASRLTLAEKRVLYYVADGRSNKEIAHILKRSIRTVENHRHRLGKKLHANSTAELVRIAITLGLTKPTE